MATTWSGSQRHSKGPWYSQTQYRRLDSLFTKVELAHIQTSDNARFTSRIYGEDHQMHN
jgi:hypothetical protein